MTEAREYGLDQQRASYSLALERSLRRIVDHLAGRPDVHRVILFGPDGRGRRDLFTDLDLLVIMDSDQDYVTRTARLYSELAGDVDLDLLVYTPREFELVRHRPLVRHALETGQVLLER